MQALLNSLIENTANLSIRLQLLLLEARLQELELRLEGTQILSRILGYDIDAD